MFRRLVVIVNAVARHDESALPVLRCDSLQCQSLQFDHCDELVTAELEATDHRHVAVRQRQGNREFRRRKSETQEVNLKQLIEYFDRAYIINLVDRLDRRRQVEREFRHAGINVPNEKVQLYTAFRPVDKGRFDSVGVRGCFTSHRNVLELANREGLRNALILEDDVSFRSIGTNFVRELMVQLSCEDWDLAFLAYLLPPEDALKDVKRPLTRWPNDIRGTHFYAVNGSFIQTMLQYMYECELRPRGHPLGGPMTADGAYNHVRYVMPNINLFVSVPSLAHQRYSRADIADPRTFDKLVWLSPVLRGLRAIKHWGRMELDRNKLRHLAKR